MKRNASINHNDLYALINSLDEIEVAILKERIYSFSKDLINNQEEFRIVNKGSLIHPDLYINTLQKVYDFLEECHRKHFSNQ
jgi:hypothetical protein